MSGEFDEEVKRALAKWPNVPHCFGWLSLDRRGVWRIKDAPITHARAIEFLSRNYAADEHGRYFVQNGPQRAYCDLAYTPWIYHLDGSDGLSTHTALEVTNINALLVDEEGDLLLETEHGIGLLIDRDLARFIDRLERDTANGNKDADIATRLMALHERKSAQLVVRWHGASIVVRAVNKADVADRYGYECRPRDESEL